MSKPTWGCLEKYENVGHLGNNISDYKVIPYEDSQTMYSSFTHAAHGMIYANDDRLVFDLYKTRAAILVLIQMQMRFDGVLGFPGGLVDPGETPVEAVNREMKEEIDLDTTKHSFSEKHHLLSAVHQVNKLVLHFFVYQCNIVEFQKIEQQNLKAADYGFETLGILRPPLFTMGESLKGFPAFLSNQFAGNAKEQLLLALYSTKIMTETEIDAAVNSMIKYKTSVKN